MSSTTAATSTAQLKLTTLSLCACSLIHAYVLISVYPYAALMAVDLLPNVTPESAGLYSGVLASSFMFGRTLSSYPWGRLGDWYGRRFVLIASLSFSALFSLLFGTSQSYAMAMVWRFLLGLTNGIVGTVKTVVSEIAPSEEIETKMMGKVVGMRALGFLLSPALGGLLSQPITQFPGFFQDKNPTWCYQFLSRFPFILPNLVGSALCVMTAMMVCWCIPETLQRDDDQGDISVLSRIVDDTTSLCMTSCASIQRRLCSWFYRSRHAKDIDMRTISERVTEADPLFIQQQYTGDDNKEEGTQVTLTSLWGNQSAKDHLIPYWIFSLAVSSLDEAFPLFCIASVGAGLGLSEVHIGEILSLSGLIFVSCQYLVYAWTVEKFGLYRSLSIGCLVGFLPVFVIPLASWLLRLTGMIPAFLLLVTVMATSKIFSCVFFTSMAVALNKTVETQQRASLNGLASLGGSVAKAVGPVLAGALAQLCFSAPFHGFGSIALFSVIGCSGMCVLRLLVGLH